MDWIRRNWPDLLIAIALVAVIAGIIATLLSGGSLWPSGSRGGGSTQSLQTGRTGVVNNGNSAINLRDTNGGVNNGLNNNANGSANLRLGNAPSANALTLGNNVEVVSPAGGANLNAGGSARSIGGNSNTALAAPLVNRNNTGLAAPLTLGNSLGSPRTGSSSINADINSGVNNRSLNNVNSAANSVNNGGVISTNGVTIPNNANPSSASGNQQLNTRNSFASTQAISVNPGAAATGNGSYKISVGAFGVAANAQNLANRLGQQGYPVGFDQQGRLNVVYVGPFSSQAEADAVARQLKQAGQDTSVYADRQASNANSSFQANSQNTQNTQRAASTASQR